MNNKFAAVGLALTLILGLTNCTGNTPANATQVNTQTITYKVSQNIFSDKVVNNATFMQKEYLKNIKTARNTVKMDKILAYLKTRVHKTPYVFSGISPKWGWDCSGLVLWTYSNFGFNLKHSATAQAHMGKRVSYKNAKPGDIVTFSWGSSYWYYHAAIYLGNGMIIDANSGYGTTIIEPLTNFKGNKIKFIRLVNTN